jgi:hypothetical protein
MKSGNKMKKIFKKIVQKKTRDIKNMIGYDILSVMTHLTLFVSFWRIRSAPSLRRVLMATKRRLTF